MDRRAFLQNSGILVASSVVARGFASGLTRHLIILPDQRPPLEARNFRSEAVENVIREVSAVISNTELKQMFINCYPNTLDTTVFYREIDGIEDTFIITGDIDAMWLRDSTAQVWPYLALVREDKMLQKMIRGLINRQTACVLLDPYANSFYFDKNRKSEWASDQPSPGPGVHERKWEVDSLCYVIRLAHGYWKTTGDTLPFNAQWKEAMQTIVRTFKTEQRRDGSSPYWFRRNTPAMEDAPVHHGTGRPARYTGMIYSMFRPSDDATLFSFLIPSNLFAAHELLHLAEMSEKILKDKDFATECRTLSTQVSEGVLKHGIRRHDSYGEIYVYEADGYGNGVFMDDANVPSLLSLPYLGIVNPKEPLYVRTRAFLLSDDNPWFIRGQAAEGNGSPHTGKESIWPMSIIMRAMTSDRDEEIIHCLSMLSLTHADTYFMHESFHKDDPSRFSRSGFAWANTLLGELIAKLYNERRYLLKSL